MTTANHDAVELDDRDMITLVDGLTAAELGEEAVVLDARSGKYFGLNAVGLRIVELIREPRAVADIVAVLNEEFEVGQERLRNDVVVFLGQMKDRKLIEVTHDAAA